MVYVTQLASRIRTELTDGPDPARKLSANPPTHHPCCSPRLVPGSVAELNLQGLGETSSLSSPSRFSKRLLFGMHNAIRRKISRFRKVVYIQCGVRDDDGKTPFI